jgi:hypothetical protein
MVCPLERKYSRKLERISLDFMDRFYRLRKPRCRRVIILALKRGTA